MDRQVRDAEEPLWVNPALLDPHPCRSRQLLQVVQRVLVRVLCPNGFPLREFKLALGYGYVLILLRYELHLHAAVDRIVEGMMPELTGLKIGAQLAVDPLEQVQVESGRHAASVVIGGLDRLRVLLQVRPQEHAASWTAEVGNSPQQANSLRSAEVADG